MAVLQTMGGDFSSKGKQDCSKGIYVLAGSVLLLLNCTLPAQHCANMVSAIGLCLCVSVCLSQSGIVVLKQLHRTKPVSA